MKVKVVGIKFIDGSRIYYFSPNNLDLKINDYVFPRINFALWNILTSDQERKDKIKCGYLDSEPETEEHIKGKQ